MPERAINAALAPLQVAVVRAAALGTEGASALALDADALLDVPRVASALARSIPLITCERSSLVLWGAMSAADDVLRSMLEQHGVTVAQAEIQRYRGLDAVRHLFSLAAGLESPRIGETEILGQLRTAWWQAQRAGRTDAALDALVQRVIAGARHIRAALPASSVATTLGEEALRAAEAMLPTAWSACRVLVVGTGDAATSTLAAASRRAPAALTVIGRTPERVTHLASRSGACATTWDQLVPAMGQHDVVFFAVRAGQPILDAAAIAPLPSNAIWIDLGAPPVVHDATRRSDVRYMSLTMLHATLRSEPDRLRLGRDAVESEVTRYVAELRRRASRASTAAATISANA